MKMIASDPEKAKMIKGERDKATQVTSWVKSVQPRDANEGASKVAAMKAAVAAKSEPKK